MEAVVGLRSRVVDAVLWSLTGLSAASTLYWSFGPTPKAASAFAGADKVFHALAYFVTSLLLFLAAVWRPGRGAGPLFAYRWVLVIGVIVAGGLVEIGQVAFTAQRQAELWDWLAEIVAALGAMGVVEALRLIAQRRAEPVDRLS